MSTDGPDIARVYGSIRTAHLERFELTKPAFVIYHQRRYDYDESSTAEGRRPVRMSRPATVWHLFRNSYLVVELNEPLVWKRWIDLVFQVAAIRLRSGRRTTIVAYCIGYSDPAAEMAERFSFLPLALTRPVARMVGTFLIKRFDRLAFGTNGSREMYDGYAGASAVAARGRLFEALPAPCDCQELPVFGDQVVFVGALSDRKGIRELMAAWELVQTRLPDATLHLVGKGPWESEVRSWSAGRAEVFLTVDPPRSDIHRILRSSSVLALLSQPVGAWREQVGLPIVEGLAHGLTIVTTEQTGLAHWLSEHGHVVVPSGAPADVVATGLVEALTARRPQQSVIAQLPREDQRIVADQWMTAESSRP